MSGSIIFEHHKISVQMLQVAAQWLSHGGDLVPDNHRENESGWESLPTSLLIDGCIRREQEAWSEFLRRFGSLIRGTIICKLKLFGQAGARSDADDVVQEVFKDLIENDCRTLSSIRNRDRIEPWLCAVALHKTIDFIRRKSRRERSDEGHSRAAEQDAAYSPSSADEGDSNEQIWEAVSGLRPDEQLLVKWYYLHRLKYREIADLANIPINTVSSRLFRIKKKLHRSLKKTGLD